MNDDLAYCINLLAESIEENEDGGWRYSGTEATNYSDRLAPIVLEGLDINPDDLRIRAERIETELNSLILESKTKDDSPTYVEENLHEFKEELYSRDLNEYQIAFPLNFDHSDRELLPDTIQLADVTFERLPRGEWNDRFVPDLKQERPHTEPEARLSRFLDRCPNDISNHRLTYWYSSYRARDAYYAVDRIADRLEILLGLLNYSATFNRIQTFSSNHGPWPDRWVDLREPFIYLLHSDDGFMKHLWSQDPTLRDPDSPHSAQRELFEAIFDSVPTFEESRPLDGPLMNSIRAFQAAITEPNERDAFFEFWRGIEILTLTNEQDPLSTVSDRASALVKMNDDEVGRIRRERAREKRNSYVHEGAGLRITNADRNLLKTLHESLIDFYIDKRSEWGTDEMRFALDQFTLDRGEIQQLRQKREAELELIKRFEDIADLN